MEAESLFGQALEIRQNSPELAAQIVAHGGILMELKYWDAAEPLMREALLIRTTNQPDDWRTFNTQSMLGGVHLKQAKYAQAEPLLLSGYQGMRKRDATIPRAAMFRLQEALNRIVVLYDEWHLVEPDQGYDAKSSEWQLVQNQK